MRAAEFLTEIIDHFAHAKETPADWWAHDEAGESYCLDHLSRDGTKFWLDLDKNGTITILWKPANASDAKVMKFKADER